MPTNTPPQATPHTGAGVTARTAPARPAPSRAAGSARIGVVNITVDDFRNVLTTVAADRQTTHRLELIETAGRLEERADTSGRKIAILWNRSASIRFNILEPQRYVPIGIAFRRRKEDGSFGYDAIAREIFDVESVNLSANSIRIRAEFPPQSRGLYVKFSIVIQRTEDGAIGIIDPGIENDSD